MPARVPALAPIGTAPRPDPDSIERLAWSWANHLAAENKAKATITGYLQSVQQFTASWLAEGP